MVNREYSPLDFDPFEGDFGEPSDRMLEDVMRKARKEHECDHCLSKILPGQVYRYKSAIIDGDLLSLKWCTECCAAMVADLVSWNEEGGPPSWKFEARYKSRHTTEN